MLMKCQSAKSKITLRGRNAAWGYLFISPWIIGLLVFTFYPAIYSVIISLNDVRLTDAGMQLSWRGLYHYNYALNVNGSFRMNIGDAVLFILCVTVVVVVFSLIIALLLNKKFPGRTFFRVIYFLPVVIMSGPVISKLLTGETVDFSSQVPKVSSFLESLPGILKTPAMFVLDNLVIIFWFCGVQMEKTGLPKVSYYAAVSLGFGGTSAFDDFSYETTDEITYERIEEVGKYSNNFNAFGLGDALKDDFSFAYDEQNKKSDQLVPKTFDEISGYIKLENGAVNRVEKESWNGDNMRAYWQQVYAYYKNQSFNNFTFSVNLKTHGSGFNIIHFSPALNGSIYESGFSFVVKNNDGNTHAMFLGNSEEATQALGGPWVGNNSTAAYAEKGLGAEFYNVKIDFTNGTAKAYINGEKVMEKTGLPKVSYYAAVSLGFGGTSAFDDFTVEETANVEHAAVNNTIAKLTVKNVDDVSEVGYDVYYTVNGAEKTDNLSTAYVNSTAAGKITYIALSERVYYLDLNTDGTVDSADLAALRKDLLGNANGAFSDVNGDKEVNILDLVHIKKVLAADRIETDCDTEKYNYAFSLSDALKSADDGKIILKPYIICDGVRIDGASAEYTHIAG